MNFEQLQRESAFPLREATAEDMRGADPVSYAHYPIDDRSPVGVNDSANVLAYYSGGIVHYVPRRSRIRRFGRREWLFVGPMTAMALIGFFGILLSGGSKEIKKDEATCEQRGGIQVKTYDGFACIKAERLGE